MIYFFKNINLFLFMKRSTGNVLIRSFLKSKTTYSVFRPKLNYEKFRRPIHNLVEWSTIFGPIVIFSFELLFNTVLQ